MKFSIKDFFSKWSHLLKKPLIENFIFVQSELNLLCTNPTRWSNTLKKIARYCRSFRISEAKKKILKKIEGVLLYSSV